MITPCQPGYVYTYSRPLRPGRVHRIRPECIYKLMGSHRLLMADLYTNAPATCEPTSTAAVPMHASTFRQMGMLHIQHLWGPSLLHLLYNQARVHVLYSLCHPCLPTKAKPPSHLGPRLPHEQDEARLHHRWRVPTKANAQCALGAIRAHDTHATQSRAAGSSGHVGLQAAGSSSPTPRPDLDLKGPHSCLSTLHRDRHSHQPLTRRTIYIHQRAASGLQGLYGIRRRTVPPEASALQQLRRGQAP